MFYLSLPFCFTYPFLSILLILTFLFYLSLPLYFTYPFLSVLLILTFMFYLSLPLYFTYPYLYIFYLSLSLYFTYPYLIFSYPYLYILLILTCSLYILYSFPFTCSLVPLAHFFTFPFLLLYLLLMSRLPLYCVLPFLSLYYAFHTFHAPSFILFTFPKPSMLHPIPFPSLPFHYNYCIHLSARFLPFIPLYILLDLSKLLLAVCPPISNCLFYISRPYLTFPV
jgi:hypothetical protein